MSVLYWPNSLELTACSDAMGSSSQHYMGSVRASTEDWENATIHASVTAGVHESPAQHWTETVEELHWMWEFHVYVIASLFSLLALYCLFTVLRLRAQLSHSKNLTSLNVFLGILGSSRLLVLFLDPYGSKLILPAVMLQVLWDLGYPCLVSSFCLLQLAVVRESENSKVTQLSESTASIVITFHFCLIITSGVLGAVQNWLRVIWIVVQVVFIIWGGFLFMSTLLGCLRTLRSIVKLPLKLLTQVEHIVDPGCEVNSIMPHRMFTEQALVEQKRKHPHSHHPNVKNQHHPRIHITDVDEQTYSYASDASLGIRQELTRSESLPMRCFPVVSPTRVNPTVKNKQLNSPNEDPAAVKPLIVSSHPDLQSSKDRPRRYTMTEKDGNQVRGPATIFRFESSSSKQSLPSSLIPSIYAEDTRKLKHRCRSRFEKNLRHLVFTSVLGIALCLLRAYDVFGLDGLMACGNTGPTLQWFFFQTISRFVELTMAFTMMFGSRRSVNSYYRNYYRN